MCPMEKNIPTSAGLSSFNLLDEKIFFNALELKPGTTMFDLACGVGNYVVAASPFLGEAGCIVAMDLWQEGIETLMVRSGLSRLHNILPVVADATKGLPVRDRSIDCCLMATVVHILSKEKALHKVLGEMRKILRLDGILAVVEFHKIEGPPGPPLDWRLSPDDLENIFAPCGYRCLKNNDVGPYNYLSHFTCTS